MNLILLVPITIFALLNIIAMIAVLRVPGTSTSKRALQCALIWLVPGFGAAACLVLAAYNTQNLSSTSSIFQSHDGGYSGSHDSGSFDGGGSGCGDGGGGC
ncbi:hypothetical protein [Methylobacillus rhizosphaerae]|uniref:hypothetical protein n=1 Tax=Methylobacillus rhizosphaerae TaxID=551994 RepID=UPI000B76DEAD|nr:hypothetical protein [Methylobacillus rhizosphaerae]